MQKENLTEEGTNKMQKENLTEEEKKEMNRLMAGQIWDECEACGEEPVYLPTMLCETCIKKLVTGKANEKTRKHFARSTFW